MHKLALYLVPILALSLGACDDNKAPKPSTSPKPSATQTKTAKPKAKKPEKKKEAKWVKFPGPEVKIDLGGAKKVWCVLPVSDSFNILKFGYKTVKSATPNLVVVNGYVPAYVPAAFVHKPMDNKKLKKGMAVMVDEAAAGPMGRVVEAGDKVKVKYVFGTSVSDATESPAQVWPLMGKIAFAEPVAFKEGTSWSYGRVAQTDKDKTWIVTNSGHIKRIDTSKVKPLEINATYKKGDSVWVVWVGHFKPAKVTEVIGNGVAYKIIYDGEKKEKTVSFGEVTKPIQ